LLLFENSAHVILACEASSTRNPTFAEMLAEKGCTACYSTKSDFVAITKTPHAEIILLHEGTGKHVPWCAFHINFGPEDPQGTASAASSSTASAATAKPLQRAHLTEAVAIVYHVNHHSAKKAMASVRTSLFELFAIAGYLQADIVAGDANGAAYSFFNTGKQAYPSILQSSVHVAARTLQSYFTDQNEPVGMHLISNSPPETWTLPYDAETTDFDCCLVHIFEWQHSLPAIQKDDETASVAQPEFQVKLFSRPLQLDNPDLWLDKKDVSWHRPIMAYLKFAKEANLRKRAWARPAWHAQQSWSRTSYKRPWEAP
jgi:hypothetical protein